MKFIDRKYILIAAIIWIFAYIFLGENVITEDDLVHVQPPATPPKSKSESESESASAPVRSRSSSNRESTTQRAKGKSTSFGWSNLRYFDSGGGRDPCIDKKNVFFSTGRRIGKCLAFGKRSLIYNYSGEDFVS